MPNPNPYQARAAKRRKRAEVGDINDIRKKVWQAVSAASEILSDGSAEPSLRLRAVHAVTQAAASYTKILDGCEFDARLRALEEKASPTGLDT